MASALFPNHTVQSDIVPNVLIGGLALLKSVHELDGLVPEGWTLAKQIIKKAGCYVCIRSYLRLIAFLACVVTRRRKPIKTVSKQL